MAAFDFENVIDCSETKVDLFNLADILKVDISTLRRYLSGKIEPGFIKFFKMARELKVNNKDLIEGCLNQTEPKNIKSSMEYLALNKNTDSLELLIHKTSKETTNQSLKKWCQTYEIILRYEKSPLAHEQALESLQEVNTKESELILLIKLVKANILYKVISKVETKRYEMMALCDEVNNGIPLVKDEFLREAFTARLNDLRAKVALRVKANVKEARKIAADNYNQNICPLFKGNALYVLSTSFLFDSYEESMKYTKMAIDQYKSAGYKHVSEDLERSAIPFVNAVFGIKGQSDDISEVAHYEAKWGDKNKAKTILEDIQSQESLSMYKRYYLALATEDDQMLFDSFISMVKAGENFFAKLPLQQLKKSEAFSLSAEMIYEKFVN